jgi:hypothetical protein
VGRLLCGSGMTSAAHAGRSHTAISDTMSREIAGSSPFTRSFKGPIWKAWRVFLAALFALPMTDEQFAISYQKHTGRNAHEASLVISRRGGKSHGGRYHGDLLMVSSLRKRHF